MVHTERTAQTDGHPVVSSGRYHGRDARLPLQPNSGSDHPLGVPAFDLPAILYPSGRGRGGAAVRARVGFGKVRGDSNWPRRRRRAPWVVRGFAPCFHSCLIEYFAPLHHLMRLLLCPCLLLLAICRREMRNVNDFSDRRSRKTSYVNRAGRYPGVRLVLSRWDRLCLPPSAPFPSLPFPSQLLSRPPSRARSPSLQKCNEGNRWTWCGLRGRAMSMMRKAKLSIDPAIVQVRQPSASARPEPRSKRSSVRVWGFVTACDGARSPAAPGLRQRAHCMT